MNNNIQPESAAGLELPLPAAVRFVSVARFVRAETLGASITMVFLGAATSSHRLTVGAVAVLAGIGLSFHLFAYLLNDVIDLPIDRTDPRRVGSPLVMGLVSPRFALALAFLQIPLLTVLVGVSGGGISEFVVLAVLLGAVAAYDWWGKRAQVPPLTDLIQGISWAALGWLAADVIGEPTRWTRLLGGYFLAFIMLANGVHGSIRDLANDRLHGARTTATLFGARTNNDGAVRLGRAYLSYALVLQGVTVALLFVPLVFEWLTMNPSHLVMAGCCLLSTVFLLTAVKANDRHRQLVYGARHLILVLAPLFLLLGPRLPTWAVAVAVACYLVPFATYRWIFRPRPEPGAHWTVQTPATP